MMEKYTTSEPTILATVPSLFNCSGKCTSNGGKGAGRGATICVSSTYSTPPAQTTHTPSSKSSAAAERTLANGTLSTFSTSASSPVAMEIILLANISFRIAPFTITTFISASTTSVHNPSNWTFATLSTIVPHTTTASYTTSSSSPSNPQRTPSPLSLIPTSYIFTQYLNSTSTSSLLSSASSPTSPYQYSSFTTFSSSTFSSSFPPSSPSTPPSTPIPTPTIYCTPLHTTLPNININININITVSILLVVLGLACFLFMAFSLFNKGTTLLKSKLGNLSKDEEMGDEEKGKRVGRPFEMESGLHHGVFIRYEMGAGCGLEGWMSV